MGRKRAPILPAPRPRDGSVPQPNDRQLAVWKDSLYSHIARMVLNHHPIKSIASSVGYTETQIRNILRRRDFATIYEQVKRDVYGHVDEILHDQRAAIADRVQAAAPLALTQLISLIEDNSAASDRVRYEAARHLLGVAGYDKIHRSMSANVSTERIADDQLEKLGEAFATAMHRDAVEIEATLDDDDAADD